MVDIFDILGPIMVGPSSSHTAGAARIGAMARTLLGSRPVKAEIGLHGSFAETGPGHGTDRALVAGILGMKPDDLRIPRSFEAAAEEGLRFHFHEVRLREAHPNTAVLELTGRTGESPWFDFLNQLRRELPVVQKQAYQLADGTVTDQLTEEQAAKIAKWRQWSYYKLMYKEID